MRKLIFSLLFLAIILTSFNLEPALGQEYGCGGGGTLDIAWNPQGTQFAISGCFGVKIYDTQLQLLQEINVGATYQLSWHPFEALLAISADTQIVIWNMDQAQSVEILTGRAFALWNRAGTQIVFTNHERDTLILYDWETHANVSELPLEYIGVRDAIWDENDRRLIFISDPKIFVWNLQINQVSSYVFIGRSFWGWARPSNTWINEGEKIVSALGDEFLDRIIIWDYADEQLLVEDLSLIEDFLSPNSFLISSEIGVSVSPDSMYVAFSGLGQRVLIVDSVSFEVVYQSDPSSPPSTTEATYQDICPENLSEDRTSYKVSWFPNEDYLLLVSTCRLAVVPISLPN